MVMFDCLQYFHVFPDGGGLLDQSPLVWHDLRQCFSHLAQALDEEDDRESEGNNSNNPPMKFLNIEDL